MSTATDPDVGARRDETPPANIWELTASAHRSMILGAIAALIGSGIKVVPYIALVEIGRGLLVGADAAHLWRWAGVAVLAMLIHAVAYMGSLGANHIAEAHVRYELRLKIVDKLKAVPLGWFNDRSSGIVRKAVASDTSSIHALVAHLAGDLANSLGTILVGCGYLLWLDRRFAGAVIAAWLVLMLICILPSMKGMSRGFTAYGDASKDLSEVTVEMVDGIKEVKNFGMTASVFSRFDKAQKRHADVTMEWFRQAGIGTAVAGAVIQPAVTLATTAALGYWFVIRGWSEPMTVLAFALVWVGILEGLSSLLQIFQSLYIAAKAAGSTVRILNTESLPQPVRPAVPTADPALIEIEDVVFSYEDGSPVINGASLTCEPGTVTALVGPSGGGKSTLARLIARFWDVDSGSIRVGGVDVREQTNEQLMTSMALVFQEVMTATDTVAGNIALGKPDATREEIIEAAKAARIHERILTLPDGYDTMLGEGAGFLSGGEAQRLTIARAFLQAPPILILDEATAQADAHCELEIQKAVTELARGRTVVMIAHRLSTIRSAHRIAVIDEGRVLEVGTHDQLIAAGGEYAALWTVQSSTMSGSRHA